MDISDVYYSDSSQLIETSNSSWCEQHTVLVGTENISWQEDGPEITVNYSETSVDQTLAENDGYLSADAGDCSDEHEASAYFSILESNNTLSANTDDNDENVYGNLHIEVGKEEVILPDLNSDKSDPGVVLYRMEGTDELFAVQIADDGNGNLHKYQYKVRQTADGFEAIPGTIEMQDSDNIEPVPVEEPRKAIHIKPTIRNIKEDPELIEDTYDIVVSPHFLDNEPDEIENSFYKSSAQSLHSTDTEYLLQNTYDQNEEYTTVESDSEHSNPQNSRDEPTTTKEVSKSNIYPIEDSESEYEIEELEEAYQDDTFEDEAIPDSPLILQHKSRPEKQLNQTLTDSHKVTVYQDDNHLSYLVVKSKEKENISLNVSKFQKSNLRSILKSNNRGILLQKPEKTCLPAIITNKDNKDCMKAIQAKAPEMIALKSTRQPRKQTIKPVERADSEITVQPLVYSLDNLVDDSVPKSAAVNKRKLSNNTEVFQVSDDSDPEYTLKPKKKKPKRNTHLRRGKQKRTIEITILDSDDDEEDDTGSSVIELLTDEENTDEAKQNVVEDQKTKEEDTSDNNNEGNVVELEKDEHIIELEDKEAEEEEILVEVVKQNKSPKKTVGTPKKNKCPICPKSFPRQITLKKHMAIHSNRRTLRSSLNKQESKPLENNEVVEKVSVKKQSFNCLKCKIMFHSENQYKRHQTIHIAKISNGTLRPSLPKKNAIITNRLRVSPRKSVAVKPQLRVTNECYKCEYCDQTFLQRTMLTAHRNTHKTFPCPKCKTTFTAKLLLEEHQRKQCTTSAIASKTSLRRSPARRLFKCGECPQTFLTPKSLHLHVTITHKRKTLTSAAKTISDTTNKYLVARKKVAHGGVPVSLKMQKAFDKMKLKT